MQRHHACWLLPAALALATVAATAQRTPSAPPPPPSMSAADPLDAAATVPPLVYRSALATFKRLGEMEALPWREANHRVGRIGGWRAYAREAAAPDAAASAAPASQPAAEAVAMPLPMSQPKPGPHSAHKTH